MKHRRIPERLNIALSLAGWPAAAGFLWLGSHGPGWAGKAAGCIGFAVTVSMLFSLLHESVHGVFHRRRAVNDWFGRISAAFFPTAFLVQRLCHLGHHRRNRTDAEMFDYCPFGTPMLLARFRLLCLLTGFFWSAAPLGVLLYAAGVFRLRVFREKIAGFYGLRPMVEDVCNAPAIRVTAEILLSIAIQALLVIGLDLSVAGWFACYWTFALLWCSIQYSTHAWSPRDIRNGAWNLRVGLVTRLLFLNYHCHLAHHRHPAVPWPYLPELVGVEERRPTWLGSYLSLWAGPRPTDEPPPTPITAEFDRELQVPA